MPPDLFEALLNPTAPLPASWPTGAWGAFLLFLFPIGGGIPTGVLVARAGGVSPPITALLYFFSDVIMAFTTEPMLIFLRWLGKRVPPIGRLGDRLARFTGQTGLRDGGKRGPLGLILVSLTLDPTAGRAAAAAAGHGFVPGWTLAIIGDMIYFVLLMVSTLWVSSVVGDDRVTLGAVLLAMWLVPFLIRRWRSRAAAEARPASVAPAPAGQPGATQPLVLAAELAPSPRQAGRSPQAAARKRRGGRRR